jgi:hypothetical protein
VYTRHSKAFACALLLLLQRQQQRQQHRQQHRQQLSILSSLAEEEGQAMETVQAVVALVEC